MIFSLTFIYDDRMPLPAEIEGIIGAARYSDILRRRVSLGEEVRREVAEGGCEDFFHLIDDRDARFLAGMIDTNPSDRIFLRLPSCLMFNRPGALAALVAQASYAPGSMLLTNPMQGEGLAMLVADDCLPLLKPYDPAVISEFLLMPRLQPLGSIRSDQSSLVDLRETTQFLDYMNGATETRMFNVTKTNKGVLRKASTDRAKMEAEYKFFHIVPEEFKQFLLPTFGFEDDGKQASYAMERLLVPDVALQFIHQAFNEASFSALVDRFLFFIDTRPTKKTNVENVRATATKTILDKMDARLKDFTITKAGKQLDKVLTAAGPAGGLEEMAERSRIVIRKSIAQDPSDCLVIGHGDPCFSNILFDRRTGMMRLIDPRGARNIDEAWMHPLYDLAKFSHSILGGYDFVNTDLFDCCIDADMRLRLALQDDGPPQWACAIFLDKIKNIGVPLFMIRAYELSLFMSMLPLHADHPRKLVGFALIAARLLKELEEDS